MAVGAAIVAADTPNIREVLRHEVDALLFGEDDPEAFASLVCALISDIDRRRQIAMAARETIHRRQFYWSSNAGRICEISTIVQTEILMSKSLAKSHPGSE
jgi:glycosyltransferase involved in cell wall biosynthesis